MKYSQLVFLGLVAHAQGLANDDTCYLDTATCKPFTDAGTCKEAFVPAADKKKEFEDGKAKYLAGIAAEVEDGVGSCWLADEPKGRRLGEDEKKWYIGASCAKGTITLSGHNDAACTDAPAEAKGKEIVITSKTCIPVEGTPLHMTCGFKKPTDAEIATAAAATEARATKALATAEAAVKAAGTDKVALAKAEKAVAKAKAQQATAKKVQTAKKAAGGDGAAAGGAAKNATANNTTGATGMTASLAAAALALVASFN